MVKNRPPPAQPKKGATGIPRKNVSSNTKSIGGTSQATNGVRWYQNKTDTVYADIFAHINLIRQRQLLMRIEALSYQHMYCNLANIFLQRATPTFAGGFVPMPKIPVNVVKVCIDTANSLLASQKPRVFFLPLTGDDKIKRKAKDAQKFIDGDFVRGKVYQNSTPMFVDAGKFGTGYMLILEEDGQLVSRCPKWDEIYIDDYEAMYDDPQEFHWETLVPVQELIARFPDKTQKIWEARVQNWQSGFMSIGDIDKCVVAYTWRKPSKGMKKKDPNYDGRYVMCLNNTVLEEKAWDKSYLNLERLHWTPPSYGAHGYGITQELAPLQSSITSMIHNLDRSVEFFAQPRVFINGTLGLSAHQIVNDVSVIKVNGPPGEAVQFLTPQAASSDIYSYVQWKCDQALAQIGISKMTAQAQKPAGLNANSALRTYQDITAARFADIQKRYNQCFVNLAEKWLDMGADLYGKSNKSVNSASRQGIEKIDWNQQKLNVGQYELQAFPTNMLPFEPAGKLSTVQEMIQSGMLDEATAWDQLDMPIVNDLISQKTAARDDINMCLSSILEKDIFIPMTKLTDPALAVQLASSAYIRAHYNKVEPAKLDKLFTFVQQAEQQDTANKAQLQQQQALQGTQSAALAQGNQVTGQAAPPPNQAPFAPANGKPIGMGQNAA